ncbi:MAG TPA: class I SAM-dependent methyltransferase family protein [Thermoplasmata archaeon]|nr:class I SAM-dependent methyltransferase family protein [Thermoplasmata archaeon]
MAGTTGPVARIRSALARDGFSQLAARLPRGYARFGSVVLLQLPEDLRTEFPRIGRAYALELGADAVLRRSGPVEGEYRHPRVERIFGDRTETEVLEHGVRYRFDAERIMFARGNKTERARAGRIVRAGELVVDLFAGIGYFTLPAALSHSSVQVVAVETNPLSYRYLLENIALNGVSGRVSAVLGDNRRVPLPWGEAHRVFLGYLPSSLPWIPLALRALRPAGGSLHVHLVVGSRGANEEARHAVHDQLRTQGRTDARLTVRPVKPYGPGRTHCVVDVAWGTGVGG